MKPTSFEFQNCVYAKDQPEYLPLPAHKTDEGQVTSCWKLSFKERLQVLFSGKIFVVSLTFNNPLQPLRLATKFKDLWN